MNILICGVGGQGVVLASRILAQCANNGGRTVRTAETIGMAQRGGTVLSHVRVGDALSPLIPSGCADIIIAFEPSEAVRAYGYLKQGGAMVVADRAIKPVSDALGGGSYSGGDMLDWLKINCKNLTIVCADTAAEISGSPRTLNVTLLGASCGRDFDFRTADIERALAELLPERHLSMNLNALRNANRAVIA